MTTKTEKAEALAQLHKWLKPGDTVYTILRHVSRSGMQRHISVVLLNVPDGEKPIQGLIDLHPNWSVAKAIGARCVRGFNDAIVVTGAGMDMGFHIVYNLSMALYPNGFGCIGDGGGVHGARCPSNDHSNGDRDYTVHTAGEAIPREQLASRLMAGTAGFTFAQKEGAAVHWHSSGGYALKHRWL